MPSRSHVQSTLLVGALLPVAGWLAFFVPVFPPAPLAVMLPAFFGGPVFLLTMAAIPVIFWAWNAQLFVGSGAIPRRSHVGALALTALNGAYLISAWSYGLRHQGRAHTIAMVAANLGWLIACAALWRRATNRPTPRASLAFHGAFACWMVTFAFPYLGEMP